jgi:NADH-quinone oxidoreductase subunit D
MELARITDHLICNSILGVDTGAYTGFLYVFQFREKVYEIYEEICGARLTTTWEELVVSKEIGHQKL